MKLISIEMIDTLQSKIAVFGAQETTTNGLAETNAPIKSDCLVWLVERRRHWPTLS